MQSDEQDDGQVEHPVFPTTRMTKRGQQVYNVMSALRTRCKALRMRISPFGRMEDMLARAHTAAGDAGLQIFVEQTHWFPSLQELNELVNVEQVADDDAQYQHNQVQLQHSAWLLSQPPGYESDADVPGETTQVTAVAHMQFHHWQTAPQQAP